MKLNITTCLLALLIMSCNNTAEKSTEIALNTNDPHSLVGVWQLVGYYNYNDNKITDSFISSDSYKQIKIYTPTKVMWSRTNNQDSTDWFGFGDYKMTDSTLTESLVYGSNSMKKFIEKHSEFHFELEVNKDTYNQIELDENGDKILAENYKRIE